MGLLWFPENGPLAEKACEAGKMDLGAGCVHRGYHHCSPAVCGPPCERPALLSSCVSASLWMPMALHAVYLIKFAE